MSRIKFSYAEDMDGTFDIIETTTDEIAGVQNTVFVISVNFKNTAELLVADLNAKKVGK